MHGLAHLRWVVDHGDAVFAQAGNLRGGVALATSDDGAGVAHPAAGWCRLTGNETHDREVARVVGREPLSGLLLSLATDLTNHDDTLGLGVCDELREHIDEVGAVEGVTADADNGRLAEVVLRGLVNGFVGQSAGAGNNTNLSLLVDVAGHDADLALARLDDARAVGANQPRLAL